MNVAPQYPQGRERSIRRRILRALGVQLYRHPFLAFIAIAVLTVMSVVGARRLEVSTNLRAHVAPEDLERRTWDSIGLVNAPIEPLVAVARFENLLAPAQLDAAAQLLARVWSDPRHVALVERITSAPGSPPPTSMPPGVSPSGADSEPPPSWGDVLAVLRPPDLDRLEALSTREGASRALAAALGRKNPTASEDRTDRKTRKGENPNAPTAPDKTRHSASTIRDLSDPIGFFHEAAERVRAQTSPMRAFAQNALNAGPDGQTLVFRIVPLQSASELSYSVALRDYLLRTFAAADSGRERLPGPARAEFFGDHIDTARQTDRLRIDMMRSLAVTALCVALLLVLAFRKIEAILFVWAPPALGAVWTYGLVSCFATRLNLLSAVLPLLLVALGIEFSVQVYYRFVEELYRERRYYPALGTAYSEAGRGVFVATIATALVFLSLYLSSFQNLRELAVVGAIGILCMAASSLLVLPPLAAVKSRLARGEVRPVETFDFGQKSLSAAVVVSPRVCLVLGLIVTAYLAFFINTETRRIDREVGLDLRGAESLGGGKSGFSRSSPASSRRLSILLEAPDLEGALARNDRLYANLLELDPGLRPEYIDSLSPVLPSRAIQETIRSRLRDTRRIDPDRIGANLSAAVRSAGLAPERFAAFSRRLRDLRAATASEPFRELNAQSSSDTVRAAQSHVVHSDGVYRVLTTVYAPAGRPGLLTRDFDEFTRQATRVLGEGAILYESQAIENRRVSETVIRSLALAVLLSLLSLALCLAPHFHWRLTDALLAALPVVCAAIWTFGLLALLRRPVSLFALLAFPIVIGVAVSQAILFIQRFYDRRYATLRQVARAGGRPAVLSGLILAIGFGALAQAHFAPLREMAGVALVAVAFSILATLVLVPAVLQIRQEGGLAAWTDVSEQ